MPLAATLPPHASCLATWASQRAMCCSTWHSLSSGHPRSWPCTCRSSHARACLWCRCERGSAACCCSFLALTSLVVRRPSPQKHAPSSRSTASSGPRAATPPCSSSRPPPQRSSSCQTPAASRRRRTTGRSPGRSLPPGCSASLHSRQEPKAGREGADGSRHEAACAMSMSPGGRPPRHAVPTTTCPAPHHHRW
jgi:hypothetical protein